MCSIRSRGAWDSQKLDNPSPGSNDLFGFSVAGFSTDTETACFIGSPYNDGDDATDAGAVYRFDRGENNVWAQNTEVDYEKMFETPGDLFGWSLAVTDTQVIVTALGDDVAGNNAGAVHVFDRATGDWERVLTDPTPQPDDRLGWSSTIVCGDRVLVTSVGATGTRFDVNEDGRIGSYEYDLVAANWGQSVPIGNLHQGDFVGDGIVDSSDLSFVRERWGLVSGFTATYGIDFLSAGYSASGGTARLFDVSTGEVLQSL